ncbi:hypothetical protein QBC37DRAFT_434190 [Rhypophila decipiens]|uniref:Aflatoxin regulatory protein domain-containing protein n=1 Tax=Rhypophila decipiens TaxID=261697 RepID=A0AAN6XUI9_9PEZI|nr:hypothetical protein QBC37DRAFT_434190 [Rhypophila decipiens]
MGSTSSLCMMGSQANALPMSLSNTPTATPTKTTTTPKSCVDAVLSAAQEAGRLIRSLLDCPTCRAGPQLQLLLTVAFAEVIACYRRVISTYKNMRTQKNGPQQDDELTRTPLSIGNHRIEGSIETMLVGRVIASRLEDLEALMREILLVPPAACSAVQGHKPEGGEPASRISPSGSTLAALLGEMYLRRDSYLAEQLSATKRELTELLTHQDARDGRTPVP